MSWAQWVVPLRTHRINNLRSLNLLNLVGFTSYIDHLSKQQVTGVKNSSLRLAAGTAMGQSNRSPISGSPRLSG